MEHDSKKANCPAVELSMTVASRTPYDMPQLTAAHTGVRAVCALDRIRHRLGGADGVLVAALILAFVFCLHGITAKLLHPDQMAFMPLFHEGELPFNPKWFEKPPFH